MRLRGLNDNDIGSATALLLLEEGCVNMIFNFSSNSLVDVWRLDDLKKDR